jgi:hypothetical protein
MAARIRRMAPTIRSFDQSGIAVTGDAAAARRFFGGSSDRPRRSRKS